PVSTETSKKVKQSKEEDEQLLPQNNLLLVFIALMMTAFLAALDQTIVATALPTIVAELGGGKDYYSYLIAAAALSPAYGKLSDIFGRKKVLDPSIVIFLVGSALCGAAKSMTWLIVARAVQGIGDGGIQQMVQVVIGDITSLEDRGTYGSFVGVMWGIAGVVGPLIGGAGALTDHVSWRWCFWINLPTGGVAGLLLFFFLNLNPHQGRTFREHVRQFDFVGLFLFVGGVVCLLLGFSQSQDGWNRAPTIALLVVGFVLILIGVWFESWTSKSPIVPPRLFQTRTTGIIFLTVFLHSFCYFCAAYYLPLYFQILGASATRSGVLIIPFSLLSSATSVVGGVIVSRMGDYRPIMWLAYVIMAIGYGLMIMLDERSSLALQIIYPTIAGIGLGFLFLPPLIGIQAAMPTKNMATTSTTFGLFRHVLPESLRQQVLHAYTPIVGVCFVVVFFLKKYSLKRKVIQTGKNGKPEVVPESEQPADVEQTAGTVTPVTAEDEKEGLADLDAKEEIDAKERSNSAGEPTEKQ
ncbi:MFS general substrate transporter, partial [Mycena amicta]